MPVKIINNTGQTSVEEGEIRKAHLEKMKLDFINDVAVASPTRTVYKKHAFLFSKSQILALFQTNTAADFVLINVSIQIPNTIDICENDESNSMAVVFELAYRDEQTQVINPINAIGEFVLINGYQDNGTEKFADSCCPSSDPPTDN